MKLPSTVIGALTGGLYGNNGFAFSGNPQAGDQQHPFVQQTARNLGHNLFGDSIANKVDQRVLGDVPDAQQPLVQVPNLQQQPLQQPALGQILASLFQQGMR